MNKNTIRPHQNLTCTAPFNYITYSMVIWLPRFRIILPQFLRRLSVRVKETQKTIRLESTKQDRKRPTREEKQLNCVWKSSSWQSCTNRETSHRVLNRYDDRERNRERRFGRPVAVACQSSRNIHDAFSCIDSNEYTHTLTSCACAAFTLWDCLDFFIVKECVHVSQY